MKADKQFINEIYEKYDEYSKEKKKTNYTKKLMNMAAVLIVILSSIIVFQGNSLQKDIVKQNGKIEEAKIQLKKVGSFENFYNTIKQNYNMLSTTQFGNNEIADLESTKTYETRSYETNTQESNVDEADIVKVNGNYIYYISNDMTKQRIIIVNAEKPETSDIIAQIDYTSEKFSPRELYVNKNKLIVIGSETENFTEVTKTVEERAVPKKEMPAYKAGIIIYDISNPIQPKEERKIMVDGIYLNSRMVDNSIYFIATKGISTSNICKNVFEELNEKDYMPKYIDTLTSNQEKYINYNDIYYFDKMESANYLILVGVNLETNEEADIQTFLGAGEYTYSSEKNMYIATNCIEYDENYKIVNSKTHIMKFSLNKGKLKYEAEADVEGIVNNQFSMSEDGGYFRIATTLENIWVSDGNTTNSLYVLDKKLEKVGEITGIAKGEKIYSVRYAKDKAYMVTFKQIDPLFVIDLSNPTSPKILGELKIPGYSTYLQEYDDKHLIGFGYNTDEKGRQTGLKLSMFDVSDLSSPKELFSMNIGDKRAYTEFAYNHKSLLYIKDKNIMAFPIINYNNKNNYCTVPIYKIDLEKGFILQGEISHVSNVYEEQIERIVYVGNTYYTLSKRLIKAVDMESLNVIKEIRG